MPELKQWAPSRWSPAKIKQFRKHVTEYIHPNLEDMVGPYQANLILAEYLRDAAEKLSRALLEQWREKTGVPT